MSKFLLLKIRNGQEARTAMSKTAIVPKLMLGASDSRNYAEVSPAVFRFSGRVKTPKWGEAHQVDERMPVDKLYMPVDFFKTFLGNYNK